MVRLFNSQTLSLTHFLVFLLLLANIGCQKEMSKDTLGSGGTTGGGGGSSSGGSAVFKLVPSGNNCSDAVVTGVIEAGTTLAADALITVTVNVTKVGDWTYSTAAADGFSFAGAGNFTTTGPQVITLNGVGKPTRAGLFSFNLTIGGGTCQVPVLVANNGTGGTGGGGAITGDFYYKLTLAGTNYSQDVTATNNYNSDAGVAGTPDAMFAGGISYNSSTLPPNGTEFGITKGTLHGYTETQAQFKAYFAPKNYSYATINTSGTGLSSDGIVLTWVEPGGNDMWSTLDGSLQTGSTFKIVSATDVNDPSGYYLKVKVQFACKFYSYNAIANGQLVSKAVTNGEAVVKFVMK